MTGYQEAHAILRDPASFSSYPNNLVNAGDGRFIPIELDPPEHTAYRKALQPLFSPTRMRAVEPQIRALITELIDGFAARGTAEFVSEFAHPLPTRVFLTLMGWPLSDAEMFTEATDTALVGKPGATEEENVVHRQEAAQHMFAYFGEIVADRRADPDAADITSEIVNTPLEVDGDRRMLTDDELCRMFFLLLIAGLHTVQGSLAWSNPSGAGSDSGSSTTPTCSAARSRRSFATRQPCRWGAVPCATSSSAMSRSRKVTSCW